MTTYDYTEAREWGARAARDILKKKRPRSTRGLVGVQKILRNYVETKYPAFSEKWKNAWKTAASEVLFAYQNEQNKRDHWGN